MWWDILGDHVICPNLFEATTNGNHYSWKTFLNRFVKECDFYKTEPWFIALEKIIIILKVIFLADGSEEENPFNGQLCDHCLIKLLLHVGLCERRSFEDRLEC